MGNLSIELPLLVMGESTSLSNFGVDCKRVNFPFKSHMTAQEICSRSVAVLPHIEQLPQGLIGVPGLCLPQICKMGTSQDIVEKASVLYSKFKAIFQVSQVARASLSTHSRPFINFSSITS